LNTPVLLCQTLLFTLSIGFSWVVRGLCKLWEAVPIAYSACNRECNSRKNSDNWDMRWFRLLSMHSLHISLSEHGVFHVVLFNLLE
jgi:hypothetical protein